MPLTQQRPTLQALLLQVIFCSRTHSQLTQFVAELRRTPFADSIAVVALASRKVRFSMSAAMFRLHLLLGGKIMSWQSYDERAKPTSYRT